MGGRRIAIQDPERIVDDWPENAPVGRERRKQEYRAQREALKPEKPAEPTPPAPTPLKCKCPGPKCEFKFPLPSPEEYFPEWDWLLAPWGPPDDDPKVRAYINIQNRAWDKHMGRRKSA